MKEKDFILLIPRLKNKYKSYLSSYKRKNTTLKIQSVVMCACF